MRLIRSGYLGHAMKRWCLVLAALGVACAATQAKAQGGAQIAVFPVTVGSASLRELAAAVDPVLVSNLSELSDVRVATRPALDLPATQLAVDCVGQTRECLRVVAAQSGVDGLIAPSVQVVGQETVVTLLYFDGRAGGDMHTVTRRYGGLSVEREALDGVPGMVRELFGLPEPAPTTSSATELDSTFGSELDVERPSAWPALPIVLTATGLALLGAGTAFGFLERSTERAHRELEIVTSSDVDRADTLIERAETQALLCNIGLAAGGAALVTGVTLWTLHLINRADDDRLALLPVVAPGQLALSLKARWD